MLAGFTLTEMLVAISVLALLTAFMGQLLNSSSALVAMNDKHMDADVQARGMLDRLAIDLGQVVKRSDVDYYFQKNNNSGTTPGNDQMVFYSAVPGYESTAPSPISLVGYRVNTATMAAERLGRGLLWNGASTTDMPMVFLPQTISGTWLNAIKTTGGDTDYESIAPGVFRFEYYFFLKGQTVPNGSPEPATLSTTPWDTNMGHNAANGLSDVSAIGVAIAVVDPASRSLVSNSQLTTLASQMNDFATTMQPGQLETQWTSAIAASSLPHAAASSIRVYGRMFYLSPSIQ